MGEIVVYGADWCPDTVRAKDYLNQAGVAYRFVDTDDDPAADAYIGELQGGRRRIPTIVFEDGSFLVEPANAELRNKLER